MTIDKVVFAREFFGHLREVGAILPSSRFLGRASARYISRRSGPERPICVLEAGAGTGSFTVEIIPCMAAGDRLDAIELNPMLCAILQERLCKNGMLADAPVEINLINGDLLTFPLNMQYDRIVSSLPLSNLPVEFVEMFLARMMASLKPGGIFSYVQYATLGRLKYAFGSSAVRATMTQKSVVMDEYADQYQIARTLVWRNVPPTWVYYWQKPQASE